MTFWSWMVWLNRSMSIVRRVGCVPMGDATHRVLSTRRRVALGHRVRKVWPRHVPGQVFGKSNSVLFGLMILLMSIGVCVFWAHAWIERWRKQRDCNPSGVFPSGLFSLGWGRRWRLSRSCRHLKRRFYWSARGVFWKKTMSFSWKCGLR